MRISNKFQIAETVYLITDEEQLPRLVTCIEIHPNNELMYVLSQGSESSEHYDFEISSEVNILLKSR